MKKPYIIAIAGGSGSGKTYLAQKIQDELGDAKSCIIYQDNYYIDQSAKFDFDGGSVNFDHPDAIDFDLLADHLKELKENHQINVPIYEYATHSRKEECIIQAPREVILVEGILLLCNEKIRAIIDESIFVETPEDIRFERRLSRDVKERGRTPEGVRAQFDNQVKPMHDQFVETSKEYAQYISSGTQMDSLFETLNRICKKFNN